MTALKSIIKYVLVFLIVITMMVLALVIVAMIPKECIQAKSVESAEYLMENDDHFYNFIDKSPGRSPLRLGDCSKVDQIADAILLSIAYDLDETHPLTSVMWAGYYDGREDTENYLPTMNQSYQRTVTEGAEPNKQYLRYWHGSLVIVRPLLMFLNIHQIKVLLGIVLFGLLLYLLALLWRNRLKSEAVSFMIVMAVISIWFVPVSLEYLWTFLLMLVVSIIAVKLVLTDRENHLGYLFMISGMLTVYFDFLTTETMTLLIPLLFTIRIITHSTISTRSATYSEQNYSIWRLSVKLASLWIVAYLATWIAKWIIASASLGVNVLPFVRWGIWHEAFASYTPEMLYLLAVANNVLVLFPFGYGRIGGVLFIVLAVFMCIPVVQGRIRIKERIDYRIICLYALLGAVVYIRYLLLMKHSHFHFFFTYRAQAATVMALCFIVLELVERAGTNDLTISHPPPASPPELAPAHHTRSFCVHVLLLFLLCIHALCLF